jgi:hypothetical protein
MERIPIVTFVNDPTSYRQMRDSFAEAGFSDDRALFVGITDADPYATVSCLVAERSEPFVVLCHQDVRLDQGDGLLHLRAVVAELDRLDPKWAIAGNAGGDRRLRVLRRITDPYGGSVYKSLPARVHSLDENFLVLRTRTGVACSAELSGFHLYATDFCMSAISHGCRAYVVDFHLRHLSSGRKDASYQAGRDRFVEHWRRRFVARYVRTSVEVLFLSRLTPLQRTLGHWKVRSILKNHKSIGAVAGFLLAPR